MNAVIANNIEDVAEEGTVHAIRESTGPETEAVILLKDLVLLHMQEQRVGQFKSSDQVSPL
ncbi:hypothetical protein PHLCEN_2v12623 [Hermanssonia centrifuga]|uniref:Uncharacterized protein n=1 Tax=Hermanssonia centrifuga TaxID=98765 RepID=A0A2R6NGI4_9APHY|nr:hypothetical protein PHLCEN_2v12623 [Hermanssonia centrifuga]